jgi:hypothetical protein
VLVLPLRDGPNETRFPFESCRCGREREPTSCLPEKPATLVMNQKGEDDRVKIKKWDHIPSQHALTFSIRYASRFRASNVCRVSSAELRVVPVGVSRGVAPVLLATEPDA